MAVIPHKCLSIGSISTGHAVNTLYSPGIVASHGVKHRELARQHQPLEAVKVPASGCAPLHFAHRQHPRQEIVFKVLYSGDILGPQIGLHLPRNSWATSVNAGAIGASAQFMLLPFFRTCTTSALGT